MNSTFPLFACRQFPSTVFPDIFQRLKKGLKTRHSMAYKPFDALQRGISHSSFYVGYVCAMQFGAPSQFRLGKCPIFLRHFFMTRPNRFLHLGLSWTFVIRHRCSIDDN